MSGILNMHLPKSILLYCSICSFIPIYSAPDLKTFVRLPMWMAFEIAYVNGLTETRPSKPENPRIHSPRFWEAQIWLKGKCAMPPAYCMWSWLNCRDLILLSTAGSVSCLVQNKTPWCQRLQRAKTGMHQVPDVPPTEWGRSELWEQCLPDLISFLMASQHRKK